MVPKHITDFVPWWIRKRKQWERLDGAGRALWFARNVSEGKMPACLRIKQGVALFHRWMEAYAWDGDAVSDRVRRMERLKPPEGRLDRFVVLPWQAFLVAVVHGFRREDGRRACREVLLVVPRKSGKSTLVAALMLGELTRPPGGIKSPQIACVGVTTDTAGMTFEKARAILVHDTNRHQKDGLVGAYNLRNKVTQIDCQANNGSLFMVTLGSRNLEGHTLSAYVADEISRMPSREALAPIRSGMHHAYSPLIVMTSTPSDREHSALDEELSIATQVLDGEEDVPGYFPIVFRAEEEDKEAAGTPELWEKVQPSLGWGELQPEKYHVDWLTLRGTEGGRHEFYTRQLCAPSHPPGGWLSAKQAVSCYDATMPAVPHRSLCHRWVVGVDLSEVDDMTAICLLGYNDDTRRAYAWFDVHAPERMVPAADVTARRAMRLRDWANDGWLHIHPGGVIDDRRITEVLEDLVKRFQPLGIYADTYTKMTDIRSLANEQTRYRLFTHGKGKKMVAEPMNVVATWVENGTLSLQQHPVFLDHVRNVVIERDKYGGRLPCKETPTSPRKIDAVDAFLMAVFGYCRSRDDKNAGQAEAPVMLPQRLPGEGKPEEAGFRPMFLGE